MEFLTFVYFVGFLLVVLSAWIEYGRQDSLANKERGWSDRVAIDVMVSIGLAVWPLTIFVVCFHDLYLRLKDRR